MDEMDSGPIHTGPEKGPEYSITGSRRCPTFDATGTYGSAAAAAVPAAPATAAVDDDAASAAAATDAAPPAWAQQAPVPPPQAQPQMAPPPQQQQYVAAPQASNPEEIRSLWIGDLQPWMEENYLWGCFSQTGEVPFDYAGIWKSGEEVYYYTCHVVSVKVIRNKQTGQCEGYGFIELATRAAAERILQTYNGTLMPNSEQNFRLNWATLGAGERRADDTPDYTIFVGDLASDVTDYVLQETSEATIHRLRVQRWSLIGPLGVSKGYGFVRFGDEGEQLRAMNEMNGMFCSTRPMRIGPAATKKPVGGQQFQKGRVVMLFVPNDFDIF
ncbi:Polyadenylate-binding protein RBP45 [Vitis vinifera]|uniref:Polyadenylate-binding protein RBP45 n=1 Tax=Vitis vinifera TaxID=29760 RepID=A0A438ISB6_VITVI|nr:Polyadenylate-binding protein RBP45 [Vitis vinifera]